MLYTMRNKLSPERKVVHKLILNQIIRDIKKFTNHNVKSIVSSFVLILFLTACEKDDALSLKATDDSKSTRSEEHTSELQSLMRISYAVFCLKKKTTHTN